MTTSTAHNWTVQPDDAKKRIDQFLAVRMSDLSRSKIQRMLKDGLFSVNDAVVAKDYVLRAGDVIHANETGLEAHEEKRRAKHTPIEIPIIYEDDAILVINKPIGLLVHPTPTSDEWTLVDFVKAHCGNLEGVGEDATRPGIVHRLDRDVSGIMVIAKTPEAFTHLKDQFMKRTLTKEYRAIVFGAPVKETGTVTFKIAHSKTRGGKMAAKPEHEEGREAWTEYEIIKKFRKYSFMRIIIKTGRTHQIRAHLGAIDHLGRRRCQGGSFCLPLYSKDGG
jgi:23S rRNA pseudouridine1911/1915/1917 synthase